MTPAQQTYGGIRQMEQTSLTSARAHHVSSGTNPYATLHHINRELMELGLPSPLMLPEHSEYLEDNQRVVECLQLLLQQRKKDITFRDDIDDELRRAMGEEDTLRSTVARLERELDAAQREAATNRIKWDDAGRTVGELELKCKQLGAELRTTRSNASMCRAQYLHDGKKREQEMIKLKDRLQKLITDKHRSAKLSVELVNPVQRDRSGRVVEGGVARDRRLMEELVGRYEATEVELIAKIEALELLLRRMSKALAQLHGDVVVSVAATADANDTDDAGDKAEIDIDHSLELLDSIRSCVRGERSQRLSAKSQQIDQSELDRRDDHIANLQAEIAKHEQEIAELSRVMHGQKQMIESMSQSTQQRMVTAVDPLEMSFSEMSLEQLDAEREAVRREREQLEGERRRFTDAAIELGNERSDLKRERDEFERQRMQRGTQELVQGLPETPQWMRGIDTTQATPMILNQLQGMYNGTPTNALLASMAAGAAYSAAMATVSGQSPAPAIDNPMVVNNGDVESPRTTLDEEFPEISSPDGPPMTSKRTSVRPSAPNNNNNNNTRITSSASSLSTTARTPASRPQATRTPVDVRSGRQARVCTRPGCAAHTPHTHDDGSNAHVMELKPPVPRFRRRQDEAAETNNPNHSGNAQSGTLPRPLRNAQQQQRPERSRASDLYK
ncbi:hypothetical protein IWW50_002977 [Coemansia erecta]|nr:hypothetical protein IWW50_002977 [Coemansia erecta]